MPERSTKHASFTVERTFAATPEKVFAAFADQEAKERWFKGPDDAPTQHTMDFRVGGHETNEGTFHDGVAHRFEATYYDIVPNERIIYTYEMYLDGKRISVSVATLEFQTVASGTHFVLTEDGVFLDGLDSPKLRQQGTEQLLEALGASL